MKNSELILSEKFGRHRKTVIPVITTKLAVKMTRVSSEKQMKNESIVIQNEAIDSYAEKNGYKIVATFGDTHESAKTDQRKEFKRMIEFCKRNKGKISTILVYKMTRFSRTGGNAMSLADELRIKYGIHIIAVTEPTDTTNATGVLFQEFQLLFAKWDNVQRQSVTQPGMIKKYKDGIWLSNPPQGYSIVKANGMRSIVINAEGKKIKKAWEWKEMGHNNEEIIKKLREIGLPMYKQQLFKIFNNPFYCGLIAHGLLDGQIVQGKHEAMISVQTFLKIHQIQVKSTRRGIPHKEDNEHLPLKVFVKCSDCGEPYTGYMVKRKNLYYYKCRRIGCKCNISAKTLHNTFKSKLERYEVKNDYIGRISKQLEEDYYISEKDNMQLYEQISARMQEIKATVEKLQERYFIKEEMTKEVYDRLLSKLVNEQAELVRKIEQIPKTISNLSEKLQRAIKWCCNLPVMWELAPVLEKEVLQKLIFPEGLAFDKKNMVFRTGRVNEIVRLSTDVSKEIEDNEKGPITNQSHRSLLAVRGGFEPPVRLNTVRRFSKPVISATHPPNQ